MILYIVHKIFSKEIIYWVNIDFEYNSEDGIFGLICDLDTDKVICPPYHNYPHNMDNYSSDTNIFIMLCIDGNVNGEGPEFLDFARHIGYNPGLRFHKTCIPGYTEEQCKSMLDLCNPCNSC